jgi:hypothetical protein
VLDKKGRVIAGNKALEVAIATGARDAIIVRSDGKSLIAVQRTDLDLERDPRAQELAIADNRVAELDLNWDPATLESLSREINLTEFWTPDELEGLLARIPEGKIQELDLRPPPRLAWILLGVPIGTLADILPHLAELEKHASIVVQSTRAK